MARSVIVSFLLCCLIALLSPAGVAARAFESNPNNNNNGACDAIADQEVCKATAGCTWCVSAAVPSSCFSDADAAKLPAAVFTCSKKTGGVLTLE